MPGARGGNPQKTWLQGLFHRKGSFPQKVIHRCGQLWGKPREYRPDGGFVNVRSVDKRMLGSRSLASPFAISYNGTNCSAGETGGRRKLMSKCRIAITADTYPYASEVTNLVEAPFAPRGLVEVIARLGAIPVVLPDVPGARGEDYVDLFDGLIIPGGPDVDPTLFGEEPKWKIGRTNYKRDLFELELFRAFYQAGKPIFGICRGCQLINIALGGNVYQDLPSEDPQCTIRHSQGAPGGYPTHHVTLVPGSSLFGSLGEKAYINSRHHQAIHRVAEALEVTAVAPDGVQESVESHDHKQVVAVQWHPENMWQEHPEQLKLFEDFLARVKEKV